MKRHATPKPKKKPAKPARKKEKPTKATPNARARKPDTSWHDRFLALLGQSCNVTLAADGVGIHRGTAYEHRNLYPDFARRWEEAEERAIDLLEEEAWKRARAQSDTLMIFLLKGRRRQIYGESIEHRIKKLTDEELIAAAAGALAGDGEEGADPS